MRAGRPRTPIGTHGVVNTRREDGRVVAETRVRDLDGRLRQVRASGPTAAAARNRLMERVRERPSLPSAGALRPTSSFADLADLWLADLDLRDLAANTKENYRTSLRLHVRPAFEHYALAEVTTGRVEWSLTKQAQLSPSQAKQTRTMLNMLFGYALRHDAISRADVVEDPRAPSLRRQDDELRIGLVERVEEAGCPLGIGGSEGERGASEPSQAPVATSSKTCVLHRSGVRTTSCGSGSLNASRKLVAPSAPR